MAGRVGNVTRMPPGGYGFGLQDQKNDGVIYLTFEKKVEAADTRKLVAEAFARASRMLRAPVA